MTTQSPESFAGAPTRGALGHAWGVAPRHALTDDEAVQTQAPTLAPPSCAPLSLALLSLLLLASSPAEAQSVGWRYDGSGHYPSAAPTGWSLTSGDRVKWRAPLAGWANSSPVVAGDTVFVSSDPFTLQAFSATDGRELWRAEHPVINALDLAESALAKALIADAKKAELALKAAQKAQRAVARKLRKPGESGSREALRKKLAALEAETSALKATIEEAERYWARPRNDTIGYASATPIADEDKVYVVFGSGVVAAYTHIGERIWVTWVGTPHRPMRGNTHGHAASPLLADGKLIVALGTLQALDTDNGRLIWRAGVYDDFGTPAVVNLGGSVALATPRGQIYRASDGKLLSDADTGIVYVGPVQDDEHVFWIGSTIVADATANKDYGTWATAYAKRDLRGTDPAPKPLWRVRVGTDAVYSTPAVHKGLIYIVDRSGRLYTLETKGGELKGPFELPTGMTSASPLVAGDFLYVFGEDGRATIGRIGARFTFHSNVKSEGGRATPTVHRGALYLRSDTSLIRVGGD